MLIFLLILAVVNLLAVLFLLLRKPAAPAPDPRLTQLTDNLPAQITRLDTRAEALERQLAQLRNDSAAEAQRTREAASADFAALRNEVTRNLTELSQLVHTGLASFRTDNAASSEGLRTAVQQQMDSLTQRLTAFTSEAARTQVESRDALHNRLTSLGESNIQQQEKLRAAVEDRLDKLNAANTAKLEEMRVTVDEKLQSTLQTRLTESFGQVTDQLTKVHTGLGEMTKLSAGVDDLSRIFTNVKSRGGFAEVQLGMLLNQMLAPNQFQQNVKVKPNTSEMVEYAVTFPTPQGETLLPIDAKFPREAWERLETAYETGTPAEIASAGKAFEAAIRTEGKRICDKYIAPPNTTNFAIMFLPTEGLYAEVMRRDGLQADIQQSCRVTIAGPSTLSAILSSFQMGFHMLQMQEKGDEVWKVLANARVQFGKFEDLMVKMDDQVSKVQKTIQDVGTRTRAINRTLRDVQVEENAALPAQRGFDSLIPSLAANSEE